MKRREFIAGLAGSAALPLVAGAQQSLPVVGFLHSASVHGYGTQATSFQQGLQEIGYREGQNVTMVYRWADGQLDRIPAMAAELVRARVAVIVANGQAVQQAKAATTTIPIVFVGGSDPVQTGLVASFNRPGGNITGVVQFGGALGTKRLELLQQIVPNAKTFAVLVNPNSPTAKRAANDVQAAARLLGLQIQVTTASSEAEMNAVFASLDSKSARAVLVSADPLFLSRRNHLAILAARYRIPAIYDFREYAQAGGLMSYGANLADAYLQVGRYTGRILKGEKPADLPVLQATKFELVINLSTARALDLAIPDRVLALADEVIE